MDLAVKNQPKQTKRGGQHENNENMQTGQNERKVHGPFGADHILPASFILYEAKAGRREKQRQVATPRCEARKFRRMSWIKIKPTTKQQTPEYQNTAI